MPKIRNGNLIEYFQKLKTKLTYLYTVEAGVNKADITRIRNQSTTSFSP